MCKYGTETICSKCACCCFIGCKYFSSIYFWFNGLIPIICARFVRNKLSRSTIIKSSCWPGWSSYTITGICVNKRRINIFTTTVYYYCIAWHRNAGSHSNNFPLFYKEGTFFNFSSSILHNRCVCKCIQTRTNISYSVYREGLLCSCSNTYR